MQRVCVVLALGAMLGCGALAGPPPPEIPPPAPKRDAPGPDDQLIEFLGSDDVGDAAWWEFLKKAPPRPQAPATPPPAESKP